MIDPVHNAALELLGYAYATEPTGRQTNCCIFAEAILKRVYPGAAWNSRRHAELMILDDARPWSPIDAVVYAGVGSLVPGIVDRRWHVVQGWSRLKGGRIVGGSRGHTFLWWADPSVDGDHILEATPVKDRTWWRRARWATQASNWDEVRLAVLLPTR